MDTNGSPHLEDLQTSIEGWIDERFITREHMFTMYLLDSYIVNLADEGGFEFLGFSFRVRSTLSLLVVKARLGEDPVVCFVSARTFLSAFKIFFARVMEGTVEWRPDKFG